jgi:hypothetical protein
MLSRSSIVGGAVGLLAALLLGYPTAPATAEPVQLFSPRMVRHAAGKLGANGGLIINRNVVAADEYYLDYTLRFLPGFDWVPNGRPRAGKLPGLAGGKGTGGCRPIESDGWSARQMWRANGSAVLYVYDQDRKTRCGYFVDYINPNGTKFQFVLNRTYRLTQRVRINTPNERNGEIQVWIDGVKVVDRRSLRLRGIVNDASVARVSQVKYHSYFGGSTLNYAPRVDSYIDYGAVYLMDCTPDFGQAPGTCQR